MWRESVKWNELCETHTECVRVERSETLIGKPHKIHTFFSIPTREHSFASILASHNSIYIKFDHWCDITTTMSKQSHFCNVDNLLSERSRNNVDYTTSIIRRQGDVETTSIFSRSTSWLHFDEISMSKWCCVPAGIPSKILSRCY
jgi:hypothetical protein